MLIKFNSDAGAFTMFGDVAVPLLKAMGQSGTIPGAILAPDIPAALQRLKAAVAQTAPDPHQPPARRDEEDPNDVVTLRKRAFPLIELLTNAAARNADVMWDVEHSNLPG